MGCYPSSEGENNEVYLLSSLRNMASKRDVEGMTQLLRTLKEPFTVQAAYEANFYHDLVRCSTYWPAGEATKVLQVLQQYSHLLPPTDVQCRQSYICTATNKVAWVNSFDATSQPAGVVKCDMYYPLQLAFMLRGEGDRSPGLPLLIDFLYRMGEQLLEVRSVPTPPIAVKVQSADDDDCGWTELQQV
jgi:hypothetical protein